MKRNNASINKAENMSYDEYINALTKISKAIASDQYLEDILKLIVVVTAEMMGSNICSLMMLNEKNELVIRATQSVSEVYNKKAPLRLGEGIAGRVAQTNKAVVIKDVQSSRTFKYREIAKKEGLRSLLSVPMSVKNKVIGVFNCYTSVLHEFTPTQINLLTSIANQAAVAIENTELMLKAKVIQEELETRKKIERAKGLLMKKEKLTEEEAYQKMRKYSMDNRKNMREVAEAIILISTI